MEKKLQTEEWAEEERIRRRKAEKKQVLKTLEKDETVEIKWKEKQPHVIKGLSKVGKTEKLNPILLHHSKSIELMIPPLREYPPMEHRGKVKLTLIKGNEYLHTVRIPELVEERAIFYPLVIAPINILKPDTARIVIPEVRFVDIPLPNSILLQMWGLKSKKQKETVPSESTGGGTEEIPDFFDILFSKGSAGKIESGEPIVICLEEPEGNSFIGALQTICKRTYREKKGGIPEAVKFSDPEELNKEIRWMKAEGQIFSAELSEDEWKNLIKESENMQRIFNRIEQLFSQGCGFIIFNIPFLYFPEHHRVNVISINPRALDTESARRISKIAWGFVKTEEIGTFDYIFESARENFEKALKSISKELRGIYVDATKQNEGNESEEHLWMKWFLVKYLTQRLKNKGQLPQKPNLLQIRDKIKTEEDTGTELDRIRADVKVGTEVYEVETLFSEDCDGKEARNKITHTIEKYEGTDVEKINIVLENLTFLRHFNELRDIKHNYKGWQKKHRKKIEFYTLDIEMWEPINIDKIAEKLKEVTTAVIL